MTTNIPPIMPSAAKTDPLFGVKQDIEVYGHLFTTDQISLLWKIIRTTYDHRPYLSREDGPTVRKHYKQGHSDALRTMRDVLLEKTYETYCPELIKQWSPAGARDKMHRIIQSLNQGIEEGLYQ